LTTLIFIIDSITPLGYVVAILYSIPIILFFRFHRKKLYIYGTITCLILIILATFFKPPLGISIFIPVPVFNRIAVIISVCIHIYSIVKRNRAEEALIHSERESRELVETANSVIVRWKPDGIIFFINEFGLKFFGYKADELVGHSVMKILPKIEESTGRDLEALVKEIALAPDKYAYVPSENVKKNGELIYIAWTNKAIKDEAGNIREILAIGNDITQLRKSEEALRKSEKKYRAIFEGSNDPIIILDLEHLKYLDANERYSELTGFTKEEILSMKIGTSSVTPPHLQSKVKEILQRVLEEKALIYDWEIKRKTGEIIPVQVSSRVVEMEGIAYEFSTLRDIRAMKRVEEILKRDKETLEKLVKERTEALGRAKKLSEIGTFATAVAHELRSPLAAIKVGAYNIGRKTTEKEKIGKHLIVIDKKVSEGDKIISNILHFAELALPATGMINVCELLKNSEEIVKAKYQKKIIQIADNTPQMKDVYINCDPDQLQEVFSNVLNNAFEALGEEGRIDIAIFPENHTVKIIIKDNGPGIPPAIRDKVFEPFVTTKSKGTGLGLAISREIIENHKGNITIDSGREEGTTVTITLPN
jgi:PAS domain S-box-containing protein